MTTDVRLTAEDVLHQAWELLVPKGGWITESWIEVPLETTPPEQAVYHACSMGAMLLAEHLLAGWPLEPAHPGDSFVDPEDEESITWDEVDEDDKYEAQIEHLIGVDTEFSRAIKILAETVAAEGRYEGRWSEFDLSHGRYTNLVVMWNDHGETTLDDINETFLKAVETAKKAEATS